MKQKTIKGRIAECLFAAGFFGGMYVTIGAALILKGVSHPEMLLLLIPYLAVAPALYAVESILFDSIRDLRKELKKYEEK